jgi:hypothetical protein
MITWVSVVVPVRHRIRATVDALLGQTYCGPLEIVLVGERDDPAWRILRPEIEAGQVQIVEIDAPSPSDRRNAGLAAATGDVMCLPDFGAVPACDWVSTSVALLRDRWSCVAGPLASSVCFTREVFERVGGFAPRHAHLSDDRLWFARMVDAGYGFLCTPLLLVEQERERLRDHHHARAHMHAAYQPSAERISRRRRAVLRSNACDGPRRC